MKQKTRKRAFFAVSDIVDVIISKCDPLSETFSHACPHLVSAPTSQHLPRLSLFDMEAITNILMGRHLISPQETPPLCFSFV